PSDRRLVRPVLPRHRLVDDDDERGAVHVSLVDEAAVDQTHAERLQVVVRSDAIERVTDLAWRVGPSFDSEPASVADAHEGKRRDVGGVLDAGQAPDTGEHTLVERRA